MKTYLDLGRLFTAEDQHLAVLFESMRSDLYVADPAGQVADLECMPQDLLTTNTFITDVIWSAVCEKSLASFGPLWLFSLTSLEALLAWDQHLRGQVAVWSVHDEAGNVLGHGKCGTLYG